jgi:ABC-2 type transport system ATP-binding protein
MMVAGELVAEGSPSRLKSRQTGHLLEFIVDHPQRAADLLKIKAERWRVSIFGDRLHVITSEDPQRCLRAIRKELEANGIHVRDAREERFSMEDVFIGIVEKARQEGKVASED